MYCPACHNPIPCENVGVALLEGEEEIFCHHCGARLVVTLEIQDR